MAGKSKIPAKGLLQTSPRAILQDAEGAMRGSLPRLALEWITNSDDSHQRAGRAGPGVIRIELHAKKANGSYDFVVRDNAEGMSGANLGKNLTTLGGQNSGASEGLAVRGNQGRGAKDGIAFGRTSFESIKDGLYSRLVLNEDTSYTHDPVDRPAKPADYRRLKLSPGEFGTSATVCVDSRFPRPNVKKFMALMLMHFQLRRINANPKRRVLFSVGTDEEVLLKYEPPDLAIVKQIKLKIEGYPKADAKLVIFRNPECYNHPKNDPTRPGGILVNGTHACYENTYFGHEGKEYAGYFSGHLECPYIDELQRQFDARKIADASNPCNLVTRSRDGLSEGHPFRKAMKKAVDAVLGELIAAEESKHEPINVESPEMQKALKEMCRGLDQAFLERTRNEDDDRGERPQEEPLRVIPSGGILPMGERLPISIYVRSDLVKGDAVVTITPPDALELIGEPTVTLNDHPHKANIQRGRFVVVGKMPDVRAQVEIKVGDQIKVIGIQVVQPQEPEEYLPKTLEFQRQSYSIKSGQTKVIDLFAPIEFVGDHGDVFSANTNHAGLDLDVLSPSMQLHPSGKYYVGQISVRGSKVGASVTLTAEIDGQTASCHVHVTKSGEGPNFRLEYERMAQGSTRVRIDQRPGDTVIRVMVGHSITKTFIDPATLDGLNNRDSRVCLAEMVAGRLAHFELLKMKEVRGQMDVDEVVFELEEAEAVYLPICYAALVEGSELMAKK